MRDKAFVKEGYMITFGIALSMLVLLALINLSKRGAVMYNDYTKDYKYERISSIQYQEKRETYGEGDGKIQSTSIVTYVYPDKMRIENNDKVKRTEIYNNDKYIYYDDSEGIVKLKECFPPSEPYITEIENKMISILKSGNYEFFGYEQKDNRRLQVIGIRSKADGHSYMHKLWVTEINNVVLPYKEEYFIDNVVVSKSEYLYMKVNEPINPQLFDINLLAPEANIVNDGVLPRYVEGPKEAMKYLNFELILPQKLSPEIILSETAVIPPKDKPSFYCIYFKDGYRIYIGEKNEGTIYTANSSLGEFPCQYEIYDEKVLLIWKQHNILITMSGDEAVLTDIIALAEEMAGGKLVKKENMD